MNGVSLGHLQNETLMAVMVGAAVLIIIAAAVFLFALGVLKRQVEQGPGAPAEPVSEAVPGGPAREFLADHLGTAYSLPSDDVQHNNASSVGGLNIGDQWKEATHQPGPSQSTVMSQGAIAFATDPLQPERMSQFPTPEAAWLPSTPVPQQQAIPTTPTELWMTPEEEGVIDPLLAAMMHQAQAGLYVVPEREKDLRA